MSDETEPKEAIEIPTIDDLVGEFQAELGALLTKWQGRIGVPIEDLTLIEDKDEQIKRTTIARNVVCAGYIAVATRAQVLASPARQNFDRDSWRIVQKSIDQNAKDFLTRAVDGQRGLRRVQ